MTSGAQERLVSSLLGGMVPWLIFLPSHLACMAGALCAYLWSRGVGVCDRKAAIRKAKVAFAWLEVAWYLISVWHVWKGEWRINFS